MEIKSNYRSTTIANLIIFTAIIFTLISCKREARIITDAAYGPLPGYIWNLNWTNGQFSGDIIFSPKKRVYYKSADKKLHNGGEWTLTEADPKQYADLRHVTFFFFGPDGDDICKYVGTLNDMGDVIKGKVYKPQRTNIYDPYSIVYVEASDFNILRTDRGNRLELLALDGYLVQD